MNFPFSLKDSNMRRMRFLTALAAGSLFFAGSSAFGANQIMACVIDSSIKQNPRYHHMPNTGTRLRCEFGGNQRPNLRELYNNGWRLIDIKHIDQPANRNQQFISPILYLEREIPGAGARQQAPQQKPSAQPQQENNFFDSVLDSL